MALQGALHGKQPGRKVAFRQVTTPGTVALVESFNDELASIDEVQVAFAEPQVFVAALWANVSHSGTDVTLSVLTGIFAEEATATLLNLRVYGQAPA